MIKWRYLFRSLNVLNGLLAAAVTVVVVAAVIPFLDPAAVSLPAARETAPLSGEKTASLQKPAPADYAVISEQNLFHPERKIPPEKQPEKVLPKPDLFLYGTLITDSASFAFVEDKRAPHSTAGRGKRQLTLKKGENLGGYILREIEASRIVLVKGEERLVVRLDDKDKKRSGGDQPPAFPAAPRAASGAPPSLPSEVTPLPQTAPSAARAATPAPRNGTPGPQQPPQPASSAQAEPSSSHGPGGIGGSGVWPPTRSSIEQTQQKVREGRLIRMQQMQKQP